MIIKEVIILAGGLGTRFRSLTSSLPKCMVPVHGKPFISYVINYLNAQGVERFIFSLGYQHELIQTYIRNNHSDIDIDFVIENEPLDTGGAARLACAKAIASDVLITYGDTFFDIDVESFSDFHAEAKADCSIALKPIQHAIQYSILLDTNNRVKEINTTGGNLIFGGIYALNVAAFMNEELVNTFSFDDNYIKALCRERKFYGFVQDAFFLDIDTPSDYAMAKDEL